MQLDFTNLSYDPKWYNFETGKAADKPGKTGAFLKVRPYPASMSNIIVTENGIELSGKNQADVFMYCLTDWAGIFDAKEKKLKCSEEIKKKIFDFSMSGIPGFVIQKSKLFEKEKAGMEKN